MREKGKGCDWWWDEGGEGRLGSVIFFLYNEFWRRWKDDM